MDGTARGPRLWAKWIAPAIVCGLVVVHVSACSDRAPVAVSPGRVSTDPDVFDVLTYNVFLRSPPIFFHDGHDRRAPEIAPRLTGYDAVVLEEAFSDGHRKQIRESLTAEYPYATDAVGGDSWLKQDGGVMVLSRWPIEQTQERLYGGACAQSDCWARKGVQYVRIAKGDRRFHVFATHLQAGYENSDMSEILSVRAQQLDVIRRLVDSLDIPADEPVLMVGDFNIDELDSGAPGMGGPEEYRDMLARLSARQPNADPGSEPAPSWDGTANSIATDSSRTRVDYTLYSSRHALPTRASSRVVVFKDEAGADLSDHYAVAGHFVFPPVGR